MNDITSIKNKIKSFPELPGIYKMVDSGNNIIYIGKSKCLRKRVQSYFVNSPKWEKVTKMISLINDVEYIVTDTHLEARLLECELIKRLQPRFNAQMKNDQRYIYLKVNSYNRYNALSVVAEREVDCFGPLRRKYAMAEFTKKLMNIYPILKLEEGYQFNYNLFPIKLNKEDFEQNRAVLLELFHNSDQLTIFIDYLQQKLEEAASQYRYEIASYYRDLIIDFTSIKHGLDGYKNLSLNDILLKLPTQIGYKLFYVSDGRIRNCKTVHDLSGNTIKDFLVHSQSSDSCLIPVAKTDKSYIDFRDILYSEISVLQEDMIEIL